MIANPRVPATHSRRILALWLITFVGVAVHLGGCAWDLPPRVASGAPPVELHWAAGAERPGEQPTRDDRHQHVLALGLSGRLSPAQHRMSRSLSGGIAMGWLLPVAAGFRDAHAGGGRVPPGRRWGESRLWSGALLLVRLCRART